ncbi:MAG: VanZ family protein [Actinobacteria bacterium]|nr:VanZ family protein [Actinomycetota bacterium]
MREWMTDPRGLWSARVLCVVAMLFVAWQSLVPADQILVQAPSDKVSHFAAYGILGFLAALSILRWRWLLAVVVMTVFGSLIEVAQSFTQYRAFELADIAADAVGAAAGAALAVALIAMWRRRNSV